MQQIFTILVALVIFLIGIYLLFKPEWLYRNELKYIEAQRKFFNGTLLEGAIKLNYEFVRKRKTLAKNRIRIIGILLIFSAIAISGFH